MKVWYQPLGTMTQRGHHIITIGNFDGVHKGHMKMIETIIMRSKALNVSTVVVTFNPHPISVLAPERKPRLLMTLAQRLKAFDSAGIDATWIIPFDYNIAHLDSFEFLRNLHTALHPVELYVGNDFQFGKSRDGNLKILESWGSKVGCKVHGYALQSHGGECISSTRIRNNLKEGKIEEANNILGRSYALTGILTPGNYIGQYINCPMASLACEQEHLLCTGTYITEVHIPNYSLFIMGIAKVNADSSYIETYIPSFQGDLCECYAELRFLRCIQ